MFGPKTFFYPTFFQTHSREYLENNERSKEKDQKKGKNCESKKKTRRFKKGSKKNCSTIDITDARAKRDKVLEPFPKIPKFKIPCRQ